MIAAAHATACFALLDHRRSQQTYCFATCSVTSTPCYRQNRHCYTLRLLHSAAMHHEVRSDGGISVPNCVLVDFYETKGIAPAARWGHTATAVSDKLYIFGGEGDQVFGDLHMFDSGKCQWYTLKISTVNGPPQMHGHAACSVGTQIYVYGGKHGRKTLHGLHRFCTDSMSWQSWSEGSIKAPALTAHTLTAVGQHGILCFGGQGKKTYNAVHKLDPATCLWSQFKTIGTPPSPRYGHTAVWDTSDSLVVFGGLNSNTQCLADVHILSLSTGYWSSPQCTGDLPRPRANHAAVMWGSSLMLVFGGCDPKAAGRFMNDVFVLDLLSFTWHNLHIVGTPPAPRYWHTLTMLQGKAAVFGGSNAVRSFDRLFSISDDWARELEDVAAEMGQMGAGSNGRTQVPSTHHMQRQLDGMLQQQSVAEALLAEQRHHHHTQHLLDSEREKLHAATSEVAQLQLLQDEQQAKHQRQIANLQQELYKLQQIHQRCTLDMQACKQRNQELNDVAKDHQAWCASMQDSKADHRALQQQCAALQQQQSEQQQQYTILEHQHTHLQQQHDQMLQQHAEWQQQHAEMQQQNDELQQQNDLQQRANQQLRQELQNKSNRLDTLQEDALHEQSRQQMPKPYRVFKLQASSCMQDTGIADESCLQQASAPTATDDCGERLEQQKSQKQDSKGCDTMQFLRQLLDGASGISQNHDHLMTSTLSQLHTVEADLEHALNTVRSAARSKSETEVMRCTGAAKQMERLLEQYKTCSLCMEHDQEIVLNCGHQLCSACSESLDSCPFCRAPVHTRTKVFRA